MNEFESPFTCEHNTIVRDEKADFRYYCNGCGADVKVQPITLQEQWVKLEIQTWCSKLEPYQQKQVFDWYRQRPRF